MTVRSATLAHHGATAPDGHAAHRPWSDFAGSAAFIALAIWLVVSAPSLSLALVPGFAYELFFAVAFLTRGRARATLGGWWPRAAAMVGTFLIPVFMAVGAAAAPSWVTSVTKVAPAAARWAQPIGALLILGGVFFAMWGLWHLRASVSLVPAARRLVTTGPYRIARHPLYLAYILSYTGFAITHPTPAVAVAMLVWLIATLARVRYEEHLLLTAFPEYADYRAQVGAFGPRITTLV